MLKMVSAPSCLYSLFLRMRQRTISLSRMTRRHNISSELEKLLRVPLCYLCLIWKPNSGTGISQCSISIRIIEAGSPALVSRIFECSLPSMSTGCRYVLPGFARVALITAMSDFPKDAFSFQGECNCGAIRYTVDIPGAHPRPVFRKGHSTLGTHLPLQELSKCLRYTIHGWHVDADFHDHSVSHEAQ